MYCSPRHSRLMQTARISPAGCEVQDVFEILSKKHHLLERAHSLQRKEKSQISGAVVALVFSLYVNMKFVLAPSCLVVMNTIIRHSSWCIPHRSSQVPHTTSQHMSYYCLSMDACLPETSRHSGVSDRHLRIGQIPKGSNDPLPSAYQVHHNRVMV